MIRARTLALLWQARQRPVVSTAAATSTASRQSLRHALAQWKMTSSNGQQRAWNSTSSGAMEATEEATDALSKCMSELALCRDQGNWRQALKLLDRLDKSGVALDADMYELAIAACARKGKIEVLPGLLTNMEVDSILPTSRTVDFVVQAYLAKDEWHLIAEHVADAVAKGIPVSLPAFEAALEACGKSNNAPKMRQIIKDAHQTQSFELTTEHLAAAIRSCGMGGRPDIALNLFTFMETKVGLTADKDVFNQLIRSQIVNGALPQALQSFAVVNDRGLVLDESIYTATIDALICNDDYWYATRLFDQMLAHELKPSVFCFGRMVIAYIRTSRLDLARICWQRIVDANEPSPSPTKYFKLLKELSTTNATELTLDVFHHMCTIFPHGVIRDSAFAIAIRSLGRLGLTQEAVDLFDKFVEGREAQGHRMPRSGALYLAVFNALSRDTKRTPKENTRDAKRTWELLMQNVPVVLPPAFASIAGVFASSGDMRALDQLITLASDTFAQQELDNEDSEDIDDDEATDAEHDRHHGNQRQRKPQGNNGPRAAAWSEELLYNGIISGFSKARSDYSTEVTSYLEMMKARGLGISDSVVRASTDAYIKHERWAEIQQLAGLVDVRALRNPELCFGDTISKLLKASAWESARLWIAEAHRVNVQPPIRGKMEALRTLREGASTEWQIAYALALETLSFKQMVDENVVSVADAMEVCLNANRADLVVKLFDRMKNHPSVAHATKRGSTAPPQIPLRMYKHAVLALMREYVNGHDNYAANITRAEALCAEMLQKHRRDLDGEALSLAISIKATVGDDDDVMALFDAMQQRGLEPNSYAYKAAVAGFSRTKQIEKVLEIRDRLVLQHEADPTSNALEHNVVKSILFSLAIAHKDEELRESVALIPTCTTEDAVLAHLQANQLDRCIQFLDETVSYDMFASLMHRLNDTKAGHNAVLGGALLLKFAALHGLASIKPSTFVLKVARKLVADGQLDTAAKILELYTDPAGEVVLQDMKPFFQKEVMEMLLYIYGECGSVDALGQLFARWHAFPLHARHYELAMEYCLKQGDADTGAQQCLQLFDSLRQLIVKPNGAVYVLGLRSCMQLKQLNTVGKRMLADVKDNGFDRLLTTELFRMATKASSELASGTAPAPAHKRGRGRPRKDAANAPATPSAFQLQADELARMTIFCHQNNVEVSAPLAQRVLQLEAYLSSDVASELTAIAKLKEAELLQQQQSPRRGRGSAGSRWGAKELSSS
ncbi:TPA: hypothetical protein N0F65_002234 [Lagenidium giganteum]|uniref:Uncharacterized protein n=1 Tax=Lagenidium giganteum TaxID=4803 RepID=A0AAV2YUC7_9STRA|nr:TPA: hypothetical protein N0F65_002234 [Lagenidium giganteum]